MKQMKLMYGRPAAVYPQQVEELVARNRYDYSQESMHQILECSQLVLAATNKVNGKTIEQLTVALVVHDFDNELEKEWVKHLGDEDELPDMDTLLQFIKPLSHNLSRKKKVLSAAVAPFRPAAAKSVRDHQSDHPKKNEEKKYTPSSSVPSKPCCAVCKGRNHPLHLCQQFKVATVQQRWNLVRQHKYCANCLHKSHTVGSCASTCTSRNCKSKHNSLLHKDEEDKKPAATVMVTSIQPEAVESTSEDDLKLQCGLINTALVSINCSGRRLTVRAALDSCLSHSIITERAASFLKPKRRPIDMTMRGTVSDMRLKHWARVGISTVYPSEVDISLGVEKSLQHCHLLFHLLTSQRLQSILY